MTLKDNIIWKLVNFGISVIEAFFINSEMNSFFDMTNNEQIEAFDQISLTDSFHCSFEFPPIIYFEQANLESKNKEKLNNWSLLIEKKFPERIVHL